jgi:hypothetical protein
VMAADRQRSVWLPGTAELCSCRRWLLLSGFAFPANFSGFG